jgi:LacI family transcriptional regulator
MSEEQLQKLKNQLTVPLVLINRKLTKPLFHTVTFNQSEAVQVMMNHLISYGHRKIACITGPMNRTSNQDRFSGYQASLKQFSFPFNPNLVTSGNYGLQDGYDACQILLNNQQSFSALLAFNDDMALGALKALTDAGIRVPEQVSIAGIDNNPMTRFSQPAISTIDLPIQEMTKRAIEIALKLSIGEICPLSYQFKGTLIQRDSILPFNSNKSWLTY